MDVVEERPHGVTMSGFPGSYCLFTILEASSLLVYIARYGSGRLCFVFDATTGDAPCQRKASARFKVLKGSVLQELSATGYRLAGERRTRTHCGVKVTGDDASIIRTDFRDCDIIYYYNHYIFRRTLLKIRGLILLCQQIIYYY